MPDREEELQAELERLRAIPSPEPSPLVREFLELQMRAEQIKSEFARAEITVAPAEVHVQTVPPAEVRVDAPDFGPVVAALSGLLGDVVAAVRGLEPSVTVNVPEPAVTVMEREPRPVQISFKRDGQGRITGATVRED